MEFIHIIIRIKDNNINKHTQGTQTKRNDDNLNKQKLVCLLKIKSQLKSITTGFRNKMFPNEPIILGRPGKQS